MDIQSLVAPYSPWHDQETRAAWENAIPQFRRPVFEDLLRDLESIQQMISIIGPRRVGKSTLLKQLVQLLLNDRGIEPQRIIYYSLDDPARFRVSIDPGDIIEELMRRMGELGKSGPAYLFLDEIQTFERWELYLKKYYDLNYPVRVVASGSASSPIFRKSHESLLGRIKDYHVLPFSFREFLLYRLRDDDSLLQEMESIAAAGKKIQGMLVESPAEMNRSNVPVPHLSDELWSRAESALDDYLVEGGFPEVWELQSAEQKIDYLFDNQVRKVIDEDLVLAAEFRKPEELKRFYISLLERPGQEVNRTKLSKEIGVKAPQIEKYLPLLEMTDLLRHVDKFRRSAVRLRHGNQKCYLVDLALRNAVLRIGRDLLDDPALLGLYAENLVFNTLDKWKGVLRIDYFRENNREVDFIVHHVPTRFFPVEVKYRRRWKEGDLKGLRYFVKRFPCTLPVVVSRRRDDQGQRDGYFCIPLIPFLLLFDG